MKDRLGTEIKVGSFLAVARCHKTSATLDIAYVTGFKGGRKNEVEKGYYLSPRLAIVLGYPNGISYDMLELLIEGPTE
jgi:hypothetical protein